MNNTISFPGLGISLNPPIEIPIVGDFSVHFYGIIIGLGLILSVVYGLRRSKSFGLKSDDILDGVLWIVPISIIGARLYSCFMEWESYRDNPISMLYIWKGGLAIYGVVIGAALGIIVFCRLKKLRTTAVLDLVGISFLIGQSIGRWGNFFNREAFGRYSDNFLAMRVNFDNLRIPKDATPKFLEQVEVLKQKAIEGGYEGFIQVHPTFLYEAVWNAIGFVLLHFLSKRRRFDGQMALCYVAWYGLGRAFIEGLRMDSLGWGDIRVSQVLAIGSCVIAVAVLVIAHFRPHNPLFVTAIEDAQNNEE